MLEGQEAINRPMYEQLLATDGFRRCPISKSGSERPEPAMIADFGMGAGWSSIAFAKAYPNVIVHGFDLDQASVDLAQSNAMAARVTDRVIFSTRDAGDPEHAGQV